MGVIVPRWEWRTFAGSVPSADAVFETTEPAVEESEELYLLTPDGDNVKVRDGLMDIKVLRETDALRPPALGTDPQGAVPPR